MSLGICDIPGGTPRSTILAQGSEFPSEDVDVETISVAQCADKADRG